MQHSMKHKIISATLALLAVLLMLPYQVADAAGWQPNQISTTAASEETRMVIGPEGGLFVARGGKVTLYFPKGAVSAPTVISYTDRGTVSGLPAFSLRAFQNGYEITKFNKQLIMAVSYNDNYVADESKLRLGWVSGGSVVVLRSWVDTDHNVVVGLTDHFSDFQIID